MKVSVRYLSLLLVGLLAGAPLIAHAKKSGPAERTAQLERLLGDQPLVISAARVTRLRRTLGVTTDKLLELLVPVAAKYARPPISQYHVGVAALGESGRIYLGFNIELPGEGLGQTVHAEQFAVTSARSRDERQLKTLALSAAPCGHCRQFLRETDGGLGLRLIFGSGRKTTLRTLLPRSFGPDDLGVSTSRPPKERGLALAIAPSKAFSSLAGKALREARRAYAPYTKSPSGVAIKTADGHIYGGAYFENAAYNPSLSPAQAALVSLLAAGRDPREIRQAVLVEKARPRISQRTTFKTVFGKLAPRAKLRTYRTASRR